MADLETCQDPRDQGRQTLKVLWFVSAPTPEASRLFNLSASPFGGWLVGSAAALGSEDVHLVIAHPSAATDTEVRGSTNVMYVAIPTASFAEASAELIRELRPDVVHVHGTEWERSPEAVRAARAHGVPVAVSIQGLLSAYAEHFMAGIPARVAFGFTLRDVFRRTNPALARQDFRRRGEIELATLALADRVIGRTDWDRAYVEQRVEGVRYAHCDESLRQSFYTGNWDLSGCISHSVLVSQGGYPLKGLHRVLEAMPAVLREYPDTHLYIAGPDPTHATARWGRLRVGSYGAYLRRRIRKLALSSSVTFLGVQDEDGMRSSFMRANVFVLPSAIENSPNSLGEAMLLGVPAVSAYVGGVPSMVGEASGVTFFQADAPYMLAAAVMQVFRNPDTARVQAARARESAVKRHDPSANADRLIAIYRDMTR